ncbi:MAG: ADOP family duplicated permease [Vicinamibacterales bacterium]
MFTDFLWRVRAILGRQRIEEELDEELRYHFDRQVEAGQRAGLDRGEAIRQARLQFGGLDQVKEEYRDALGVRWLDDLRRDLRIAGRSLAATPLATAVAVLSLALVIGANTAIFSILNGLLLRSLPVRDPARLVHVTDSVLRDSGETRVRAWSYPAWKQFRQRPQLFDKATAWSFTRFDLASGGETQLVEGMWADGSFFEALGVPVVLGRPFSTRDDQVGGGPDGPVAVVSYGYWQRQLGGDPDAIGRPIRLNGVLFSIVGVTPPDFFGLEVGRSFDVIVPLGTEALIRGRDSVLDSASTNFLSILARLKPEQTLDQAIAALRGSQDGIREATVGAWGKEVTDGYLTSPFTLVPAARGFSYLRSSYERPLIMIAAIVGLVLVIGCVNVANLSFARAIARRHELSVRLALGASRSRLVRQLLAESLALAASGAALGVWIAAYGGPFLVQQLSTPTTRVFLDVSIDTRVLAFTAAITALAAVLFGTAPAFRGTRVQPAGALKEQGRSPGDHGQGGLMGSLVAVQVALSLVLIVTAGLFIGSFRSLVNRDLGLQPAPVLVIAVDLERSNVDASQRVALYERVREAILAVPAVGDVAISYLTPVGGGGFTPPIELADRLRPGEAVRRQRVAATGDVFANLVSPGWFRTFGTPLVAGRDFADSDRGGSPRVAIVNEAFARRYAADGNAIGRLITVFPDTPRALTAEIVGVAADAIYTSPHESAPPTWYLPLAQFDVAGFPFAPMRLSVRARTGAPERLKDSIAAAVADVDPRLALTFRPLEDQIHASLTRERLMAQLAGFLGVLALLLAGLGLYGITAYAISRQRSEIAIRMALGAAPAQIVARVVGRLSLLVGLGIVAGTALSLWASQFVGGLIYGLTAREPLILLGATALLCVLAAVAAWFPARNAIHMDPVAVLRQG